MRHTITVTIEVEADTRSRKQVIDELLGHITNLQDQQCHTCSVLPGGREVGHKYTTLSVASAQADGITTTAGLEVPAWA